VRHEFLVHSRLPPRRHGSAPEIATRTEFHVMVDITRKSTLRSRT